MFVVQSAKYFFVFQHGIRLEEGRIEPSFSTITLPQHVIIEKDC